MIGLRQRDEHFPCRTQMIVQPACTPRLNHTVEPALDDERRNRDRRDQRLDRINQFQGADRGMHAERPEPVRVGGPVPHFRVAHGRPRRRKFGIIRARREDTGGRSGISPLYRIARNGASSTCRATGLRLARCNASVAPVEKPITATETPGSCSRSNDISASLAQSRQFDAGMTGPGPSCPGKTGADTRHACGLDRGDQRLKFIRPATQAMKNQASVPLQTALAGRLLCV